MDENISEKARNLKAKVEKFNKDFAPEVKSEIVTQTYR